MNKIILFVISIFSNFNCISDDMKKVENPQKGNILKNNIALVYSSKYQINLAGFEKLHPFDINKYSKIYLKLIKDKLITPKDIFVPEILSEENILKVHTKAFLKSLDNSKTISNYIEAPILNIFPAEKLINGLLKPFRYSSAGTLLTAELAMKNKGIGINIGGGYHHAKPTKGEGFCIYADIAIAIKVLQEKGIIEKALIVDVDIHQGNGNAVCFANDQSVFTFSMHEEDIYPEPKEKSDLDIGLNAGTNDKQFLKILDDNLSLIFKKFTPDVVFIVGGCDTLKGDPLANCEMSEEGIVKRDAYIIEECVNRKIPVILTLGGGYSPNAWHAQYMSIKNLLKDKEQ